MRKKILHFLAVLALIFLAGCSAKKAQENKPNNAQGVQYTQKQDIIIDNRVKMMSTVTDLTSVLKDESTQKFLVSLYEVGETSIDQNRLKLLMNEEEAITLKRISKEEELYKKIPLKNVWASHFVVEFAQGHNKMNHLTLQYRNYEPINFQFLKAH